MRKSSRITMYTTAIILCAAGVLCAAVSGVWSGKSPFAPGLGNGGAAQTPAPALANLNGAAAPSGVITANTDIFWVTRYLKCGHEIVRELPPDGSMVGKTYTQFAQCYPLYTLDVENGTVRMVIEYNQYCPDHYIIQSDDNGNIYVYRNTGGEDKLSVVMKMNFTVDDVPQDYRPLLKQGMVFDSVEGIEGLIESAET